MSDDRAKLAQGIEKMKTDVNTLFSTLQQWVDKSAAPPQAIMDEVWNITERLETVVPILAKGNDEVQIGTRSKWKEFDEAFVDYRVMLKREGWLQAKKDWAGCAEKAEQLRKLVFALK